MLLVLTNSEDATADYLQSRLCESSVPFIRINTDSVIDQSELSYQPKEPLLHIGRRWHKPHDFSNVWYRRPEKLKSVNIPESPEGRSVLDEWTESLEGFLAHIPRRRWMNHPAANALASRKLEQLSTAARLGLPIPDTILTQDPEELKRFFEKHSGEVVAKPLGKAYIQRSENEADSLIYTNQITAADLDNLSDLADCPTLFQRCIRKASDLRITFVDGEMHAAELIAKDSNGQQRCDIRRNNMEDVQYRCVTLPARMSSKLRKLVSFYGLRFAAIDVVIGIDGEWHFLEVNPNGQWAWMDLQGGSSIYKSFVSAFRPSRSRKLQ